MLTILRWFSTPPITQLDQAAWRTFARRLLSLLVLSACAIPVYGVWLVLIAAGVDSVAAAYAVLIVAGLLVVLGIVLAWENAAQIPATHHRTSMEASALRTYQIILRLSFFSQAFVSEFGDELLADFRQGYREHNGRWSWVLRELLMTIRAAAAARLPNRERAIK